MNNKYLIIGVLSIIIVLLCCGIGYMLFFENTKYTTTTIAESGTTFEIPDNMVVKSNDTESGITVLGNDNTLIVIFNSADKSLAQIMSYATIKSPIFGTQSGGNLTMKNPAVAGCSLDGECNCFYMGNNDTHDNIIVISKNKDIVTHIINSIKWGKTTNSTADTNTASEPASSQPSAYAYKSDGTPMYSEGEVNEYMLNKYGKVNYHVGDNGYVDMDEPGYDDAGNKVKKNEK